MKTNNFKQSIGVIDENAAVPRARLITTTDYCITTTDYKTNIDLPVDRSALALPSAPRGVEPQEPVSGSLVQESFVKELAPLEQDLAANQVLGARLTIGYSISMDPKKEKRRSKGSYRGHLDVQFADQVELGLKSRYTTYLTTRRRNFANEVVCEICEIILCHYDQLRASGRASASVWLGHCHDKGKKDIISDMGVLVDYEARQAFFYCDDQVYEIDLDDEMTSAQEACGFFLQGQYGSIRSVQKSRLSGSSSRHHLRQWRV